MKVFGQLEVLLMKGEVVFGCVGINIDAVLCV